MTHRVFPGTNYLMPFRKIPLVTGQIYHIYNRGVNRVPIFEDNRDYQRFRDLIGYYRFIAASPRFSSFKTLKKELREKIIASRKEKFVDFIAFCLMPNHFHFVLKQLKEKGISEFLRRISDGYTRYFNTKHKRIGPLFQGRFKSVLVETDEQLAHLVRYVHINPYTSYVVRRVEDLLDYPWSSFREYLDGEEEKICDLKDMILASFKKKEDFKKFTLDQADYGRKLEKIKHLLLEE